MITLSITTDVGYKSIPIPERIILPITPGKLGMLKYQQHPTEPFSVEQVEIRHAGDNRVKISMRGSGRLDVKNFPDPKFDGAQIEMEGDIVLNDQHVRVQDLHLQHLDLPKIPSPIDNLIRKILNKNLIPNLAEILEIDLEKELNKVMKQMNCPNRFMFKFGNEELNYEFCAGVNSVAPHLNVSSDGFHLRFYLAFIPSIRKI